MLPPFQCRGRGAPPATPRRRIVWGSSSSTSTRASGRRQSRCSRGRSARTCPARRAISGARSSVSAAATRRAASSRRQLKLDPGDAGLSLELGKLALADGDLKRATALFERALELDPELDEAEYGLAECRGKSGDARGQWTHLGRAFELRGDLARAKSGYEKALELVPEDGPEHTELRAAVQAIRPRRGRRGRARLSARRTARSRRG